MFLKLTDKTECTIDDIRLDHPKKRIPSDIGAEDLLSLGYADIVEIPCPAINSQTHTAEKGPVELIAGTYQRTWIVSPLSNNEVDVQAASKKALLLSFVDQRRDKKRYADVTAHDRKWQADPVSKGLMSDAILFAQSGAPLPSVWRDVDNNNMEITSINDLLTIAGQIAIQTESAYAWSWQKKAEIVSATSLAELENINLND